MHTGTWSLQVPSCLPLGHRLAVAYTGLQDLPADSRLLYKRTRCVYLPSTSVFTV